MPDLLIDIKVLRLYKKLSRFFPGAGYALYPYKGKSVYVPLVCVSVCVCVCVVGGGGDKMFKTQCSGE